MSFNPDSSPSNLVVNLLRFKVVNLIGICNIGTQIQKGNQFVQLPSSSYGAVNNNFTSLPPFIVDTNDGVFLFPNIPFSNLGWFYQDSGTTIFCNQNLYCNMSQIVDVSIDSLMERIVTDSLISSEFISESKLIAHEKLFNYLMEDSDRYIFNTVLDSFVLANIVSSLDDLFIIENLIAKCYNRDEESTRIINDIDSTIAYLINEVTINDSLAKYYERSLCIDSLNQQIDLRNHIDDSLDFFNSGYLDEAQTIVSSIETNNTPQVNRARVFNNIIKMLHDHLSLDDMENEFQEVAIQCPSSGGTAVFVARAVLEEKYDTLLYDDRTNCAYEGYFRMLIKNDSKINSNGILLIPNPATTSVNIRIVKQDDLISDIEIFNNVGIRMFAKNKLSKNSFTLNTINFANGIYIVKVKTVNGYYFSTKLIIIK